MEVTHEQMMREMAEQFQPILDKSPDGVYLWLDEEHAICNKKMADMFGYTVDEWRAEPFLETFVARADQSNFARNYQNRVATFANPVTFRFQGRRKDGSTFAAETDMIPLSWRGHAVAYHFVRKVAE
jgi:PAS domain S-box-containing protein